MMCDNRERVRRAIYDAFAADGRAPHRADIAATVSMSEPTVDEAMRRLAADRHLALDESGDIVMAHPFSSVNLGFSVMGRSAARTLLGTRRLRLD